MIDVNSGLDHLAGLGYDISRFRLSDPGTITIMNWLTRHQTTTPRRADSNLVLARLDALLAHFDALDDGHMIGFRFVS